jgi:hypothetical protein
MLSRDEFLEKYRHHLRSVCLDGFIIREAEDPAWKWRRMENNANKIDNVLAKIFDELTKKEQPNGKK